MRENSSVDAPLSEILEDYYQKNYRDQHEKALTGKRCEKEKYVKRKKQKTFSRIINQKTILYRMI